MKTSVSLVLLMFVSSLASPVLAAGKTAKALLPSAAAAAKKWQADGALVNIDTKSAQPDGTVATGPMPGVWAFTYYSPKTKQKALIMVDGKGKLFREDSGYFQTRSVGEFSVDSNQAMAAAVKNGLKTHTFGMSMGLESNDGRAEWRIADKEHFYYVDAGSGKFLRKEKND